MDYTYQDIAKMIDHSLLKPNAAEDELEEGCQVALAYDVATVCMKPYYLGRCARLLAGSTVVPTTTVGFPHGGHRTETKVAEAEWAIADGAGELDMVVNLGQVLSGKWDAVQSDIAAVVDTGHQANVLVKVIFENCYLEDEHKVRLCEVCAAVGADFVKTSTGYGDGGATLADLKLMRAHSPASVRVKAAGGIRTLDALLDARAAGASRVGASRTEDILDECKRRLEL